MIYIVQYTNPNNNKETENNNNSVQLVTEAADMVS